ncbi:hypothetical protein, conserved [Babesia bigemina]|uniref:Uncharacterized protein n=1 Tax=Babesia bigemina TaxID=5866 RepID=A0A061D1L7_BABBI|nr:hypothetical protein, conserved [Babesia bigemina]CDR94538.1 hypothetical protein, conserved [Babesia bigemina]|eukprot:XP_012766724.1 hypothetical protein, conserved [Babesia bigemina]
MAPPERAQSLLQRILRRSQNTPRILWWQASEILYKLQRRQRNDVKQHPCVATCLGVTVCRHKLVRCMRRFPHNATTRCAGEASRHYQCTVKNDGWTAEDGVNYARILDFDIFDTRKPAVFTAEELQRSGIAVTNNFVPNKRFK